MLFTEGYAEASGQFETGEHLLNPGDIVHVLHYGGEGFWKVWYQGKVDVRGLGENFELVKYPDTVWWVKVKNARGEIGWS